MTAAAQQLIQEIQDLPAEEQEELIRVVQSTLKAKPVPAIRYVSKEEAKRVSERIFDEYADLFRKLAQ